MRGRQWFLSVVAAIAAVGPMADEAMAAISTVDRVEVKDGHLEEALYYYEQNWKRFRTLALERGYISGFQLLVDAREPGRETLLLVTRYADENQYDQREANFETVMSTGEEGVRLLNDLAPPEFRQVTPLGVFESD